MFIMLPTFTEFVEEGRMGRLIDAARNDEIRQEDVFRIKTYEDLKDYCRNKYKPTDGRNYYITLNNPTDGKYIALDHSQNGCIFLNYADSNSDDLLFSSVEKLETYSVEKFENYIYNRLGIDKNTYDVVMGYGNESVHIIRKDKKPITIEACIIEIYDKFIAEPDNEDKVVEFNK